MVFVELGGVKETPVWVGSEVDIWFLVCGRHRGWSGGRLGLFRGRLFHSLIKQAKQHPFHGKREHNTEQDGGEDLGCNKEKRAMSSEATSLFVG
jgi:hypothetical protein